MGLKIIIVKDQPVNQQLLRDIISLDDNNAVLEVKTPPLSIPEVRSRIEKALAIAEPDPQTDDKSLHSNEIRVSLMKVLADQCKMPFAVILIKPNGEMEWANDGFERFHGFRLEVYRENFGSTIYGLDPASSIANLFNQCLKELQPLDSILQVKSKNGKVQWFQVFFRPLLNAEGFLEEIMAIEFDITSFKQKELELHAQNRKMKDIMRNLEHLNAILEDQKQEINQQKLTIELEQEKSEKLLLNILPFEVARQLKSKGRAGTRQYKLVSVLFADFKGFSRISKTLDPKDLVSILDAYFATFDEITARHYIEKIKTIGDAYMCAGGLPLSNKSNPIDAVLAGLEIQHYMNTLNDSKVLNNLTVWELRLGIHTGPVVAGVVGRKRFAYDIWGDTVNIASRMEQSGHVGMVNISGGTYDYIKDFFDCDNRGKIETKNMGKIDMYFVNRIKPEFSQDNLGILPNERMMNLVNKL
jgi:PAS domain S-box-containing protein